MSLLKATLDGHGYRVHTASCPNQAIKLYEERGREISMVLLDFLLPKMSGDMVFENLQRLNPDVRVIFLDRLRRFRSRGHVQERSAGLPPEAILYTRTRSKNTRCS